MNNKEHKNKKNKYSGKVIAFLVFCVSIFVGFLLINNGSKSIKVELIGDNSQTLSVNSIYLDSGFEIIKDGKIVDKEKYSYIIKNDVNTKVVGKYDVTYKVNVDDKEYTLTRKVEVIDDIAPEINVNVEKVSMYYCKKEDTVNLDYTATDNYDGVLTDKVDVKKEKDKIVLSVTDSSNNSTVKEIPIEYKDNPTPTLKLNGTEIVYKRINTDYKDSGVQLYDGCGNKIDGNIKSTSNVNTRKEGKYKVEYNYYENGKMVASIKRTVIIYDVANIPNIENKKKKVVYLTFDDGPGVYTESLLKILKKYDVKATFFVTNQFKKYTHLIKDEYEQGHSIGVHTLTHKWTIYKSKETYVKDFNDMNNIIEKYTGNKVKIFRFPGGSSNTVSKKYSKGVVSALASYMQKEGYAYFDWNVDSNDAAGASSKNIYKNVISGMQKHSYSVILMHDIKKNTVNIIEDIINYGLANGYEFKTLDTTSPTTHHTISN